MFLYYPKRSAIWSDTTDESSLQKLDEHTMKYKNGYNDDIGKPKLKSEIKLETIIE
jgi:hypothetical protein